MPFGQLVVGSPGSGKTTYCYGVQQFLAALGRPCAVVNLDPANHRTPYECAIDIGRLITVSDVMKELGLGPNGAMLYCVEYLEANLDWLEAELDKLGPDAYVVFDLPGQVELSTNHGSVRRIVEHLQRKDWRLVAVHLLDATHITDASRYVALLLLSLRAMLTLEMPHVNVLSKVDLLGNFAARPGSDDEEGMDDEEDAEASGSEAGPSSGRRLEGLEFNLDFYTEVQDLSYLSSALRRSQGPRAGRFAELNERICEIVEEFGLVSFETLAVEDKRSMLRLLRVLDKACGYVYVQGDKTEAGGGTAKGPENPHDVQLPDEDDAELAAYEPGSLAATTAGLGRRAAPKTAASAAALFGSADRGVPMGWGSAKDVQERFIDHREDYDRWEAEERERQRRMREIKTDVKERPAGKS